MRYLASLFARLRDLFQRDTMERDLKDELEGHVTSDAVFLEGRGLSPHEALRMARARLGGFDAVADSTRAAWGGASLAGAWHYVRIGARALRRSPLFTGASIVTLLLCSAGLTVTGTLLYRVAVAPLPWPEYQRMVRIAEEHRRLGTGGATTSIPNFLEWRTRATDFERIAIAAGDVRINLTNGDDAESVRAARISDGWPEVFGQRALLGRTFEPADLRAGGPPVILLGTSLWRRIFASDPGIIGRIIRVNGMSVTVVGVLPAGFGEPGEATEAWIPINLGGGMAQNRWARGFTAAGRLKPGVGLESARAKFDALSLELEREFPGPNTEQVARVTPWAAVVLGDLPRVLRVLAGGSLLVLLIGAANVGYLAIVRLAKRRDELAVRVAFGAGRGELFKQLLVEHGLLVMAGGAGGIVLGWAVLRVLPALAADALPRSGLAAFAPAVAVTVLVALLALAAAVTAIALAGIGRIVLLDRLRGGPRTSEDRSDARGRYLFVSGQVASAFVLILAAGLVLRSVRVLLRIDPGFDPVAVATARLAPRGTAYLRPEAMDQYAARVRSAVQSLPGAVAVTVADEAPVAGDGVGWTYVVEGQPAPEPGSEPSLSTHIVGPGYMEALRIPLVAGDLGPLDRGQGDAVVVSERFARDLPFPSPLGHRIKLGSAASDNPWLTIVAVVGDVRHGGLGSVPAPDVYQPFASGGLGGILTVMARFSTDPAGRAAEFRHALSTVDATIPAFDVRMLDDLVRSSVARTRFLQLVLEGFAALALVLAISGVLGVQALAASQTQRAQAIRLALGARPWSVVGDVLRRGAIATAVGLAAGVVLGLAGARLLRGLLFETSVADPIVLVSTSLIFAAIAALANLAPAWMIARTDPARVLR